MMGLSLATWVFGCVAAAMLILAAGFVLWPLRGERDKPDTPLSRKDMNINLYRERVEELRNAVAAGEMTAGEAQIQEEEAGRHLLIDAESESAVHPSPRQGGGWLVVLAAACIPLVAGLLYLQGDSWRLLGADDQSPPWDFIVQRAEKRLEKNPQDIETRVFLARSYRALEQYEKSAQAYAELNRRIQAQDNKADPDYLVEEGEMWALTVEGNLQGRPRQLFRQALAANPEHGRALWYAGLAALQSNDEAEAIEHWQALARQELPENFRHVLSRQLQKLGAEAPAGPEAATKQASAQAVIKLRVARPSEEFRNLPPETPVFVYARGKDGPRRPLAAQRMTLSQLPADVVLTDAMQMAGGPALSDFDAWTVYARIALGGVAQAQAGDPYGELELNRDNALKGEVLTIRERWPE